jgi:hypothetical protein
MNFNPDDMEEPTMTDLRAAWMSPMLKPSWSRGVLVYAIPRRYPPR